uniref:Calponin-homology (CH) domain-containing protein n=1 Tax=Cynoglossus semilaevis TaxID=244447 RepID=A0A3P8WWJ2_CYNSE
MITHLLGPITAKQLITTLQLLCFYWFHNTCQVSVCVSTDEKEAVQERTFTRWMNVFLQRCHPPLKVQDLFVDIQDGRILMALLEELTGCKLCTCVVLALVSWWEKFWVTYFVGMDNLSL